MLPVVSLIGFILVSVYTGLATFIEAAAIGVAGALIIAGISKNLSFPTMRDIILGTVKTNGLIMFILTIFVLLQSARTPPENHGQIISITTAQALIGFPNASAYAASKHALHGFLETLQLELGNKIKISNVYLGWIKGTNLRANALGPDELGAVNLSNGDGGGGNGRAKVSAAALMVGRGWKSGGTGWREGSG